MWVASVLVAALALYIATLTPGVGWQDSGIHQYRVVYGQLEHDRGLALSHPLHYWLGRAVLALPGTAEPARRLNLLSAVSGAIGVAAVAGLVRQLTRSRSAGLVAAAAVGLAHAYWQMSVVTEVYTLAAALMTLEWCLLLRYLARRRPWALVGVFALNGLHLGAHQFALLTLVPYVVLAVVHVRRRRLAGAWLGWAAAAWLLAGMPNWLMMADYARRTGDIVATMHSFLFGAGWADDVLNAHITLGQLRFAGLTLGYCFPSAVLPLALVGLLWPARRRGRVLRRVLLVQTLLVGGFVIRYPVVDLYTFFVPVCALLGVWFGLGADRVLRSLPGPGARRVCTVLLALHAAWPVAVYAAFPALAAQRQTLRSRLRDLPHRDAYRYFFQPWRGGDDSAARFAHEAIARVGAGGWLLADSTTGPTAAYVYRVHGGPPGVRIYDGRACLVPFGGAALADADLAAHLAAGGRAVAISGQATELTWAHSFELDRSDAYYWVITGPAPQP